MTKINDDDFGALEDCADTLREIGDKIGADDISGAGLDVEDWLRNHDDMND